jgi:hypothetical protein
MSSTEAPSGSTHTCACGRTTLELPRVGVTSSYKLDGLTAYCNFHDTDAINTIGRDAGLKMTADYPGDDGIYYGEVLPKRGNFPPLLLFKEYDYRMMQGHQSHYTINLVTGKPTKESGNKTVPKKELVSRLYREEKDGKTLHSYFKKMPH